MQTLAETISMLGASFAVGIAQGIAEKFFNLEPGELDRIANALTKALTDVITILIGPGGPMFQLTQRLTQNIVSNLDQSLRTLSLGGYNPDVPLIPSFATGGVMPYDGLAYLHKNEIITPGSSAAAQMRGTAGTTNTDNRRMENTWYITTNNPTYIETVVRSMLEREAWR